MNVSTTEGPPGVLNHGLKLVAHNGESTWKGAGFEGLFVKFYPRVVAVLYRLIGDRAAAEELANDVFWKLYRQAWLVRSDGNVGGWLHRTATNLGIDHLRALGRRRQHEDGGECEEITSGTRNDPLDAVLRAERSEHVRDVLARLKTPHAQILILRASGLSYKELADTLGVRLGTVGTMLVRAEAAFLKQFRRMYGIEEAL